MKAGIDFGTSLVKAYWKQGDFDRIVSSAMLGAQGLAELLKAEGVTAANAIGIGSRDGFESFTLREPDGDPLAAEIAGQVRGTRLLPGANGLPRRFTLVSIGTGTSYAEVDGDALIGTRLGNPMGGGYIAGLGRIFMMGDAARFDALAAAGVPPDTLMKHAIPALDGQPMGEFVVSHFNRASIDMEEADFAAGILHCVAVSIVRDLMADPVPDAVFIGSTCKHFPSLNAQLGRYLAMLGKTAHFPDRGEFAGAVGAYHRD